MWLNTVHSSRLRSSLTNALTRPLNNGYTICHTFSYLGFSVVLPAKLAVSAGTSGALIPSRIAAPAG